MLLENTEERKQDTIQKLKRVYNVNKHIPEEDFNIELFFDKSECGTQGCLIGNAIAYDPFFSENGLKFNIDKEVYKIWRV